MPDRTADPTTAAPGATLDPSAAAGPGAGRRPVRIANASGFFGDRIEAAAEMVRGGPIDVLTGDWLAELTMLILARQRLKRGPGSGYAGTFLTQLGDVLGDCLDRGIKVVSNAGGLDPEGLARAVREQADAAGLHPRIAVVTGDDLLPRLGELRAAGEPLTNLDTGEAFAGVTALTANAYLGGAGITAALRAGADVVICGRVTDAALAIGPAAWWHGWDYAGDLDPLAGALVAGHVIECGTQATGGNYPFFTDVPGLEHPGFPIAEIAADGTSVITKHPGTGGMVSVGTVTAQLLYEVAGRQYPNPDVTADFAGLALRQVGPDRVRIDGARGYAPPPRLKVSLNYLGGFRNSMSLVLTGLDVDAKADLALRTIAGVSLADSHRRPPAELARASTLAVRELDVAVIRSDQPDPADAAAAQAHLRITVKDGEPGPVGKAFTERVVASALASYPGLFPTAPPAPGTPYGVFWPTTVARDQVPVQVRVDDGDAFAVPDDAPLDWPARWPALPPVPAPAGDAEAVRVPLGWVAGARSGDKGGTANIGVWIPDPVEAEAVGLAAGEIDALVTPVPVTGDDVVALWRDDSPLAQDDTAVARADAAYGWLCQLLADADAVTRLLPEARGLRIDVHRWPRLRAVNLVIHGLLGRGVTENTRLDPQAKGLAEQLRARVVTVPVSILDRDDTREPAR